MSDDVTESTEIFNPENHVLFDVTAEIPKSVKNKYEMDYLTDRIHLDRILFTPTQYPYDYSFIEGTLGLDGDPLDTMAIGTEPTLPSCLTQCHAVVVLHMTDGMGGGDKVLCIPTADARCRHLKDLDLVAEYILLGIERFFNACKDLEPGKPVEGATWASHKEAEGEIIAFVERARDTSFEHHHVNLA